MKPTALLLAAIGAVSVSASGSWLPGQVTIKEDFKVPGSNPLYFCDDPKDNILEIEKVDLSPNPPEPYVATVSLSWLPSCKRSWAIPSPPLKALLRKHADW